MRLSLTEIVTATGGHLLDPGAAHGEVFITGVSTDTRTLQPGDLFVPLSGPRADGHTFLREAALRGATAALWAQERPDPAGAIPLVRVTDPLVALGAVAAHYRRRLAVTIVGITGSVGKTTTTKMTAAVLATRFRTVVTKPEWNAEVGVPLTILGLREPDQVAVIEMAMRALGQIAELVKIAAPGIGVVTAIGETHLEFLGTTENIATAKGELIAGLPPAGIAVLNADDVAVRGLATLARGRVVFYGLEGAADVVARQIRTTRNGVTFSLQAGARAATVTLKTWGHHNVRNALAAAAVGLVMDVPLEDIVTGLERVQLPHGRLEPVQLGDVLVLNDTYNASPASVRAGLAVLAELASLAHRVAVLGEMRELGPQSDAFHREVGRLVADVGVRMLVTVGEQARAYGYGAAAGLSAEAIVHVQHLDDAVRELAAGLRAHDVVLVKGSRAMAMERIVERLQSNAASPAGPKRRRS